MQSLTVCRNLLNDKIFGAADEFSIAANLIEKAEQLGLSGNIYRSYLIFLLAHEPNLVSETAEKTGGMVGKSLRELFIRDIKILLPIFLGKTFGAEFSALKNYSPTRRHEIKPLAEIENRLENLSSAEEIADAFIDHYKKFGTGDIAFCRAFRLDSETKKIHGINNFEKIRLSDLIGYEHQKELLTKNTEAFLSGKPANNVLLVGARGTGKSSGVKALVNEYYEQGLRLLQITKPQLKFLPQTLNELRNFANKQFIIFFDDLSFDESETEYKYLKSSLEGGIESRPENVLIYATSNRRHLIRETWRDRIDGQDELYRDDSVNETISLSDRFGLIIHYYAPTQDEYLEIIRHMLRKKGIDLDGEDLRIAGTRWEMTHSGRNGRTAQQFVNYYVGQK